MNIKEKNPALYEDLMRRLKRIEGQARGVQRMLEEGQDCEQILIQLGAMKSAINRVGMKAAACNMGHQVTEALKRGEDPTEAVDQVIEQFIKLG
ncbi:DNA-binding FrmR family transcriptional regulator [Symbiobacterium terraclitae]|uniref:DNA-binding FrmR family transcriptional regulator n=1 Tax=Symbiobacterium terraclitae TaxID=557451 RepID=A0ABS4JX54_9FIRM|nr:metal-sensitive transcriptional regulator [Symbiobacterium terraclitae]MBP2020109.1 DNA-binding FrmR family transcriptional regulator [Symbiobacterium terraclitae]